MMRLLTLAAALLLLSNAHAAQAGLRGARDQGKQGLSWVGSGQGGEAESVDMPRKIEPEHRKLPPLSHGWAYEGGAGGGRGGRKEAMDAAEEGVKQQQQQEEGGKSVEPLHRVLPPLSHGWAYEGGVGGGRGGRKEAMDAKQQQEGRGGSTRPRDIARAEAGKRLSGGGQGWHPEADIPRMDAGDAAPPAQGEEGGKL